MDRHVGQRSAKRRPDAAGITQWFLNDRISEIRQDVAVVKVRVESLSKVTEIKDGDVQQAQYVLVETPTRTARDELIRQILLKKGEIDGTP